jgi:hypothetical protein
MRHAMFRGTMHGNRVIGGSVHVNVVNGCLMGDWRLMLCRSSLRRERSSECKN